MYEKTIKYSHKTVSERLGRPDFGKWELRKQRVKSSTIQGKQNKLTGEQFKDCEN